MAGETNFLIVDDEAPIRDQIKEGLAEAGFGAETAGDGEEALAKTSQHNSQIFFVDLNLPGMSGVELCRRLKSHNPLAVVYAMTGYSSLFELAACREAGFDDYFTKPVDLPRLIRAAGEAREKIVRWRRLR